MTDSHLLLLLLFIAGIAWFAGSTFKHNKKNKYANKFPKDYLVGLNYLLNEQPDKAVDVFLKMLEVDSDTVETHLALGNLFRRRGEVDRAIRIHQNLIARPNLGKQQRTQALLELGQDYMRAGVLDRAERIFLDITNMADYPHASLQHLLDIYQQEKAWEQAIIIAHKFEHATNESMKIKIAHYYCELAQLERTANRFDAALKYLKKALVTDRQCVRASLLHGDLALQQGNYPLAIRHYKYVKQQDADYLSETINPLVICYEKLQQMEELIHYFSQCLTEYNRISLVLTLAECMRSAQGVDVAINFIIHYLKEQPSIRGLKRVMELQLQQENVKRNEEIPNLHILNDLTANILKDKPVYRCRNCGFHSKTLHWLCPRCKSWSTVKPIHGLEGD